MAAWVLPWLWVAFVLMMAAFNVVTWMRWDDVSRRRIYWTLGLFVAGDVLFIIMMNILGTAIRAGGF